MSEIQPQKPQPDNITRREFNKIVFARFLGLWAITHVQTASSPLPLAITTPFSGQKPDLPLQEADAYGKVEKRFAEAGMSTFYPFYAEAMRVTQKYAVPPNETHFNSTLDILSAVARGDKSADDPEVAAIRDGWGTEKSRAVAAALAHIDAIDVHQYLQAEDIILYPEYDTIEGLKKNYFAPFARVFAPLVLAMPGTIAMDLMNAYTSGDLMSIPPPALIPPEYAYQIFYHEAKHEVNDNPTRIKPYIEQKDYLRYAKMYFTLADEILDHWFSLKDPEEALRFWEQAPFYNPHSRPLTLVGADEDAKHTEEFLSSLETDVLQIAPSSEFLGVRFLNLYWAIGRRLLAENKSGLSALKDNPDVQKLMSFALFETMHYLVYPLQDSQGRIVGFDAPLEHPEAFLTSILQRMYETDLATLSSMDLPRDSSSGPMIRSALGLKDEPPAKNP